MAKDNQLITEENEAMMASEPFLVSTATISRVNNEPFSIPSGMPQSVDEALADIEEGEREFERGETSSHREVMKMIWDKIGSYAG